MIAPVVITGRVVGSDVVVHRLSVLAPEKSRRTVAQTIKTLGVLLQNKVKFEFLTGRALHHRSGRLMRSINSRFTESSTEMISSTGTSLSYGRFWELGFHGMETVHAHVRRVKSRNTRGLYGGRRIKVSEGVTFVREYGRNVNQDARPFLRPALEEMRATIHQLLSNAVSTL